MEVGVIHIGFSGTPSSSWTEYSMTIGPAGSGADYTHMAGVKFIRHGWLHNYTGDGSATAEFQGWKVEELDSTLASNVTVMGNAVWHAGNDGASSGLDADLLDRTTRFILPASIYCHYN